MGLYFAQDGNWGNANDLVLIDNDLWGDLEYRILDEAGDEDRARTAELIQKWVEDGRPEIMDDPSDTFGIFLNLEEWYKD